jgi:hypothetical protein
MRNLLLGLIGCFVLTSCKKDDSGDAVCELSSANLTGRYLLKSIKLNGVEKYDDTLENPICERDDIYVISVDNDVNTWNVETGPITCVVPRNETSGDWELLGDTLFIYNQQCLVSGFSCSGFTIAYTDYKDPVDSTRDRNYVEFYEKQ